MKKIILMFIGLLIVCGCSKDKSANTIVKEYLDNYKNLSADVKSNLINTIKENKDMNDSNKEMYKKVLLRQYQDLNYTILTEDYDNDKALITVNVEVYDLNKAEENALDYLSKNLSEFYNEENVFDNNKYIDYKLNYMFNSTDRINYNIVFLLNKKDNKWVLEQPTDDDLEKIHGIYVVQ